MTMQVLVAPSCNKTQLFIDYHEILGSDGFIILYCTYSLVTLTTYLLDSVIDRTWFPIHLPDCSINRFELFCSI